MKHIENSGEYAGLSVNKGISQPPSINPYLAQKLQHRRREYTAAEYIEEIRKGNITVLSQAVTLVESQLPEHQTVAQEVITGCLPYAGNSVRIGITGDRAKVHRSILSDCMYSVGVENLPYWPLIPVANAPKGAYSATRHVWRGFLNRKTHLYGLRLRPVLWAVWPVKREKPSSCAKQRDLTRFLSRP